MGPAHMKNQVWWAHPECARWSNRLLIASLIGIVCLTLFPFQFNFAVARASIWSPFLLGKTLKQREYLDGFLNILLFIPFGFAVSCELRGRGASRARGIILAFVAGAIASYCVELTQFFIPQRNSAWDDVGPNSLGALTGALIFEYCGNALLRILSKLEEGLEEWLTPIRTAALLLLYFALCIGVSIPLQQKTRLSNWDAQCGLFVGNDGSGKNAWKGQVARLQIWNRAIPEGLVSRMTIDDQAADADPGLLVSYDFTTPAPYADQRKFLPALSRISTKPPSKDNVQAIDIERTSWLGTENPVGDLTRKIQETNQFTVRVVCVPAAIYGTNGRIVSISQSIQNVNMHLRQEGTNLVLWIRNPLSDSSSLLAWYVPNVFESGQRRDIVATYDGSDATIYLDGKKVPRSYRLSAGASLAQKFLFVRAADLSGYVILYETLIFLPAGLLIGMAARKWSKWNGAGRLLILVDLLLPPLLLEGVLIWVSGRVFLPGNVFYSLLLSVAGVWIVNADRRAWRRAQESLPVSQESLQAR